MFFCRADDPSSDPNVTGDPYKTLFVARLVSKELFRSFLLLLVNIFLITFVDCISHFQNYETTESRVKREFEAFGPIKRVGIIEHPFVGLRLLDFGW